LSPRQSLQDKKADLDPPSLHRKIPFPTRDVRDRFDDWVVGLQFVPDYLHHPVFRYRTPRVIRGFVPRTAGFFEFVLVSASVSARQKGGSGPSVSASKNSVPDSDFRDWFDDWVVGHQFVPKCLHHPVSANCTFPIRRQIGRFCGISGHLFRGIGLCRRSRILAMIFGALSLHPKIPFPAARLVREV
jgi:hypothetical protein